MYYEEKYNEALNWMREIYPTLTGATKEDAEHYFPELKESEDERIRKELIHIVEGSCSKYGIKYKEDEITEEMLLAYLEKQKETKINEDSYRVGVLRVIEHPESYGLKKDDEPICDELSEEIERISKRYPEVSFAKLSRIAVHFAKWQKEPKPGTTEDNPIDPFDTKLFQDGVKEGRRLEREDMLKEQKSHIDWSCLEECPKEDEYEVVENGDATGLRRKEQKPRKFKFGDKVHWHDDDTNVITITGYRDDAYLTDSAYGPILFSDENNWELVEQKPVISVPIFRVGDYIRNKKTGDKVIIEQINVKLKLYFYVSWDDMTTIHSDFKWENQNDWELIGQKIEQNPSEKQDYSDLTDFERAIHRGFLCAGNKNVSLALIKETAQDCLAQIKPAEWSEEDKKLLDFWLCVIDGKNMRMDKNIRKASREFINRLKSLRPKPHWKPSEEQMEELDVVRRGWTSDSELLDTLYNDLKKLM